MKNIDEGNIVPKNQSSLTNDLEKLTKSLLLIVRDAEAENKGKTQLKQSIKNKVLEEKNNEN